MPEKIVDFIHERTLSYGKVKLVLKHNRYYIHLSHPETLQYLLNDNITGMYTHSKSTNSIKTTTFTTSKVPVKGNFIILS